MAQTSSGRWPRKAAVAVGLVGIASLFLSACGGSSGEPFFPPASAQTGSATAARSGSTDAGSSSGQALFKKLLGAKLSQQPRGYGRSWLDEQSLDDTDRANGLVGIVKVTFQGTDDKILIGVYASSAQAAQAGKDYDALRGGSLKFLPYLPGADCADRQDDGTCGLQIGNVFLFSTAASVDHGAATLVQSGKALVDQARTW